MKIPNSEECGKSELDLFSVPPTQTAVEEGVYETISPHPNFKENRYIRFDIAGTSNSYINLSETELHLTVRMIVDRKYTANENPDGTTDDAKCGTVNNLFSSLFEQLQVSLNNTPVENSNNNYAYRAYLENLLCYGKEAKETLLYGDLWIKDTADAFDNFKNEADFTKLKDDEKKNYKFNKGFDKRQKIFQKGASVQLCGKLHADIFNCDRYMLNNVNIQLTLQRSKEEFYMKYESNNQSPKYKILIDDAKLKVRRVTISPAVMLAHALALEKATAKYPIKRVLINTFNIPYASTSFNILSIHTGIMPTRVVIGFVKTSAYGGDFTLNPFNFINLGIKSINLKVGSKKIPYQDALEFDFSKNMYYEGYLSLFKNIREAPNDITYEDYGKGNTLFAFDLTPDMCSFNHYSLLKDGELSMNATLQQAIADSITTIVYLEFDNIIEITSQRQILYDYKV